MALTDTQRIERLEHDVPEIAATHMSLISELRKGMETSTATSRQILLILDSLMDALLKKGVLEKSDLRFRYPGGDGSVQ